MDAVLNNWWAMSFNISHCPFNGFFVVPQHNKKILFLSSVKWEAMITERASFSLRYAYLRSSGRAFKSEEEFSSVGGKSSGSRLKRVEVIFMAHSTAESTIWSKLKSSDSNLNSYLGSYSSSSSYSLVKPSIKFTSKVWSSESQVFFQMKNIYLYGHIFKS